MDLCSEYLHLLNHVLLSLSFPLQLGEPDIKITPTDRDRELYVAVNETVKLNCTAWKTDYTKLTKIEWFNPQNNVTHECNAESVSQESNMSCTFTVSTSTNKALGVYTCRATNFNDFCSNTTIRLVFQRK